MSRHPLLARVLAVVGSGVAITLGVASPACSARGGLEKSERCYTPGQPYGDTAEKMPDLPCLAVDAPGASRLNPGCTNDFRVLSGPTQKTTSTGASCCYLVEYEKIAGCQVGRPLLVAGALRVARLAPGDAWA